MVMQLDGATSVEELMAEMAIYGTGNRLPVRCDDWSLLGEIDSAVWGCVGCGAQLEDPRAVLCRRCDLG